VLTVPSTAELRARAPRLLAGLLGCGIGLAAMVRARLGLGPWEVLHQGISNHTGVPIGTVGIGVGALVLLGWLPLKQRLGVGTISNVILIGLTIDAVLAATDDPTNPIQRVACLVAGITLFGAGSGLYIGAGLGPGPRDGLMTGIAGRPGTRYSVRIVRTAIELSALAGGWLLGGNVGIGTLAFAFAIGPLVQLSLSRLTIPTLTSPAE
jgi:uncharacterized membrane protein YczE